MAAPSFNLPGDAVPKKYTVDLTIDPSKDTFDGKILIDVELKTSTDHIWINAKDLTPLEVSVGKQKAHAEPVDDEFFDLALDSPTGPGRTTISIRYQGKLDENAIVGPYRKKSGDDWYVFTSFTPIDARRAFPCFDEPRFKTPWTLTIHVKRGDMAFANGKMTREVDEPDGMKAVHFATTEPLPSEVVAFAVGPFDEYIGAPAGHGTAIHVITARGHGDEGKLAAQASVDVLPRLEAYTGIPYPFGKLYHLAVPEFPFGATENPGLIVYRNRSLLAAPGQDTPAKARSIRALQAHEVGHQWFGDMVTQANWTEVWLSEGFATWIAAKMMDEEQPPARKHLSAVISREQIMAVDASGKARPVRLEMHNREEMKGVYARTVYNKGAAILLMVEDWLGEERTQQGLRSYLKDHRFGNATTADLEAELRKASGVDPAPVMDSFLNQTGIPEIKSEVRCDGAPKMEIEQTNTDHQWNVPVCWRTDGSQTTCTVLDSPRREVALASCPAWIYLNAGGTGYYRTEWTAAQLGSLDVTKLSAAERMTLVGDLRALKPSMDVSGMLGKLATDSEPEIAKAASDALK